MAQVTVIKVVEGSSNVTIRVNMVSDGTGELVNFPIFGPADCNPPRANNKPTFYLMQGWNGTVWFDVTISAGLLQPAVLWTFARDCDSHVDFRSFGGIPDQNVYLAPPVDDNGILSITTNNFAPLGSTGTLILQLQKMGSAI